jgi:hypothetical protein
MERAFRSLSLLMPPPRRSAERIVHCAALAPSETNYNPRRGGRVAKQPRGMNVGRIELRPPGATRARGSARRLRVHALARCPTPLMKPKPRPERASIFSIWIAIPRQGSFWQVMA